ncbi:ABC transporter substrate-binding protein [Sorangium sp. So ce315]|uniref:MlaC/ttg2D family ABC transporter substrate-binding protein n=1 Tax=Sorangium sp. So ce315 TaxID=3133299 RepID=UPI003F5E3CC1
MTRRMNHLFAATFSLLALTLGPVGLANAGPATDVVKAKQTVLFDLLKQGGEGQKKVGAVFDEMLDYSALAESSLGSEWATRTDAEKKQFTDLLKQLVRKAYERNLKKTLDFNVEYTGESESGGVITVKTRAVSKKNAREEPVEIAFKLTQKGGTWLVRDIVTEGVSLVGSYRAQFTKIIKKDGFPALVQKMKDKLAKGDV